MKLLVVNSKGILALLIKVFTFSKWNHTAIYFDDYTVIDSLAPKGVRLYSYNSFKSSFPIHEIIEIDVPNIEAAKTFAFNQLYKKYDWKAIIALPLQRKWNSTYKWFCSELSEAII